MFGFFFCFSLFFYILLYPLFEAFTSADGQKNSKMKTESNPRACSNRNSGIYNQAKVFITKLRVFLDKTKIAGCRRNKEQKVPYYADTPQLKGLRLSGGRGTLADRRTNGSKGRDRPLEPSGRY